MVHRNRQTRQEMIALCCASSVIATTFVVSDLVIGMPPPLIVWLFVGAVALGLLALKDSPFWAGQTLTDRLYHHWQQAKAFFVPLLTAALVIMFAH